MKIKPGKNAKGRGFGEHAAYYVGRATRASLAFVVCGIVLFLLWRGWFPDLRAPGADLRRVGTATLLTGLLAFKIAARVRTAERRRTPRREAVSDAELGLLLLTTVYLLLAFSGGVGSAVYPLVYAVVSFLVTFHRLVVGLPLAGVAIGFEAVICFGPGAPPETGGLFAGHAGFIAVFALLNVVFLHAEVARQRREHLRRVDDEVAAMREEARDFRLISTALSAESRVRTRAEEQEKLSQGSIQTIHQQLYYNLDLLRTALGLQTCALLWLDESGERLKVKELGTDSPHVVEGAISRGRRRAGRDPEGAAAVRARVAAAVAAALLRRARDGRGRSSASPSSRGARRAASWCAIAPPCASSSHPRSRCWRARRRRSCASCSPSACSRRSSGRRTNTRRFYARRRS